MKQLLSLLVLELIFPSFLFAGELRIYCMPDKVLFESKTEGMSFTEENKMFNVPTLIIDESEIPRHRFRSQLRCRGDELIVDKSIKTPSILRAEAIERAKKELDVELEKEEPDVTQLIRIQRDIEKMRKGDEQALPKYGEESK